MTALTLATFSISHHALEDAFANPLQRFRLERKPVRQRYFGARLSAEARYSRQNGRLRSQMQSAVSHDAVPIDHPAEAYEPSPAKQRRVATTATLLAVALCAFMAKGHLLAAQTPSRVAAAAQGNVTAPVTIIAPEFCKDQTWPYIDSRCLRRVDNPPPDAPQATVAPATTAATPPAPSGESRNTVAATPPTAATTAAQTNVAQTNAAQTNAAQTTSATNTPPAAAAPNTTETRDQVIQSVFPAAAPDTRTYPATNAYTRESNASQRRRSEHWNNHSGFFGFRF
jgi:hypothetical protein